MFCFVLKASCETLPVPYDAGLPDSIRHLGRIVETNRTLYGFAFPDASGQFSNTLELDGFHLPNALDAHQLRQGQMQKSQNSFSGTSKLQNPGSQLQYAPPACFRSGGSQPEAVRHSNAPARILRSVHMAAHHGAALSLSCFHRSPSILSKYEAEGNNFSLPQIKYRVYKKMENFRNG